MKAERGAEIQHLIGPVLLPGGTVRRSLLSQRDGVITEVKPARPSGGGLPAGAHRIASGCVAVPGLVDMHTHGGGGLDVAAGEVAQWGCLSDYAAAHGATASVPALISSSPQKTDDFLRRAADIPDRLPGARIPGVHLEGPYLAKQKAGAHPPQWLRSPDPDGAAGWLAAAEGRLKMVTVAPELQEITGVIKLLLDAGVIVAAGHTSASYEEMMKGFSAGISHAVHLFNAMTPFHHRRPGAAWAALMHPAVSCELICDGVHLHPAVMRAADRIKDPGRLCLVTDSCPAAGLDPGRHQLAGQSITVDKDCARTAGGALAGSILTPVGALRKSARLLGWSLGRAVQALSEVPAQVLGLPAGRLEPGRWADIAVLDEDWSVRATVVGGRLVHGRLSGRE